MNDDFFDGLDDFPSMDDSLMDFEGDLDVDKLLSGKKEAKKQKETKSATEETPQKTVKKTVKKGKKVVAQEIEEIAISDLYFAKKIDSEIFVFCNSNRLRSTIDVQKYLDSNPPGYLCSEKMKETLARLSDPEADATSEEQEVEEAKEEVAEDDTLKASAKERIDLSENFNSLKLLNFNLKNKLSEQALKVCVENKINTVGCLVNFYNNDVKLEKLEHTTLSVKVQLKDFLDKLKYSAHIFAQDVSIEEEVTPKRGAAAKSKKKTSKSAKAAKAAKEAASPVKEKAISKTKAVDTSKVKAEEDPKKKVKKVSLLDDAPAQVVEKITDDAIDFEYFEKNELNVFLKANKLNAQVYQAFKMSRLKTVEDLLEMKKKDASLRKLGIRAPKMKAELKKFMEYVENPVQEKEAPQKEEKKMKLELDASGKPKDFTIEVLQRRKIMSQELYKFCSENSLDRLSYIAHYYMEYKSFDVLVGYSDDIKEEIINLVFEFKPELKS